MHKSFAKVSADILNSSVPSISFSRKLSQYCSRLRLLSQLQTSSTVHDVIILTGTLKSEEKKSAPVSSTRALNINGNTIVGSNNAGVVVITKG